MLKMKNLELKLNTTNNQCEKFEKEIESKGY